MSYLKSKISLLITFGITSLITTPVTADQVFNDDLIVNGSSCIGQDCVNGENFGFDTLRLKENNLRIKFEDTSTSASFPTNDWQLTANDSANGGANKFSIDDIDGGKTPFTIEAGAPSHSLFVEDGGRIGFGTATPVVNLHVKEGNTPTLRLEQDGSSGFSSQTWDMAGNETNFFIRDVSNGSLLPFRIFPSAPTNSLVISSVGNVGIGIQSPSADLHVVDNAPSFILENTSTTTANKDYVVLRNYGASQIVFSDTQTGEDWKVSNTGDAFKVTTGTRDDGVTGLGQELSLDNNGNLDIAGVLNATSSRLVKENIQAVNAGDVLSRLADLGVYTWNYIKEDDEIVHLGPMAEDFHDAFSLNGNNTGKISYTDISGVTIAAIKALKIESDEKDEKIQVLEQKLENIQALLEKLSK